MDTVTKLERAVLEKLLAGQSETFRILRGQLDSLEVASREMTGVGFWTDFTIGEGAKRLPGAPPFRFGDVVAELDALEYGAGIDFLVKEGRLSRLEGCAFDDPWPDPDQADDFALRYESGTARDEAAVIKSFTPA